MAIAKQSAGVTIGYKPKLKQVERCTPTLLQRAVQSVSVNARELREFAADEIVYATMDTVRLLNYLRYEFGWVEGRRRPADRGPRVDFAREAAPMYTNLFYAEQVAVEPGYPD